MDNQSAQEFDLQLSDIEKQIQILQYQVLNNLDSIVCPDGKPNPDPVDIKTLDRLVKRPMMLAITRLKHARSTLIRLINRNG